MINEKNTTVIICAAGMGTRLGTGATKALLKLDGKSLIARQLEMLESYDDIRVVVGFQAEKVIEEVNKIRKDITFAFNYDYKITGPAESLYKALFKARENVIALDGDLLIAPDDFARFSAAEDECVGYTKRISSEPIGITVDKGFVTGFGENRAQYEWAGVMKIKSSKLLKEKSYVYKMLEPSLPLKGMEMRVIDIDTIDDYEAAYKWIKSDYSHKAYQRSV